MKRVIAATILAGAAASAHHSFQAMYLMDQRATIEGTVAEFQFRNPHTIVLLDVGGQRWEVEWGTAVTLASQGVQRYTLRPGDRVSMVISPGKPEYPRRGVLRVIRRADGFEWGTRPGEVAMEWAPVGK